MCNLLISCAVQLHHVWHICSPVMLIQESYFDCLELSGLVDSPDLHRLQSHWSRPRLLSQTFTSLPSAIDGRDWQAALCPAGNKTFSSCLQLLNITTALVSVRPRVETSVYEEHFCTSLVSETVKRWCRVNFTSLTFHHSCWTSTSTCFSFMLFEFVALEKRQIWSVNWPQNTLQIVCSTAPLPSAECQDSTLLSCADIFHLVLHQAFYRTCTTAHVVKRVSSVGTWKNMHARYNLVIFKWGTMTTSNKLWLWTSQTHLQIDGNRTLFAEVRVKLKVQCVNILIQKQSRFLQQTRFW